MVRLIQQQIPHGTDLLAQYRASGAPEVFAQIMRAYGGMVFSVCLKVTKDAADAEDASQATFLTLAVQCKTGATITYLGPWLKKVAKRSSLDLVRSRKRRTRRETITAENRPEHYRIHPSAGSEHNELSAIIRAELDELPAKYRMPLVLHYFGGLSHDQISREMQCTTAALGVRLHRARKMLGKRLSARGVSLEGAALGAAIAIAINCVIHERFIESTTNAMLSLQVSRPLFGMSVQAMHTQALGAHLPASLNAVPQLVQEVAQSMARTRMRMATLALGISITMLGGAAEAVRHLPDSIRPNLEFLSPSKMLEDLFRYTPPLPRIEMKATPETGPKDTAPAMAQVEPEESDAPVAPVLPVPPRVQRQPVMAMEFATPVPPIATRSPVTPLPRPTVSAPAQVETPRAPAHATASANAPAPERPRENTAPPVPAWSSGAARTSTPSEESPSSFTGTITNASSRDANSKSISQFVPAPSTFRTSSNLEKLSSLRPSPAGMRSGYTGAVTGHGVVEGVTSGSTAGVAVDGTTVAGPAQLVAYEPMSLTLRSSDLYVPGDGSYNWSDSTDSIVLGGVNSVDVMLSGVTSPGVLSIEHLSANTTLAPQRPTGHTFVGIWSMDGSIDYSTLRLTVRYDYALAETLGLKESVLKLWVYRDQQWVRINDSTFARDLENHALSGSTTSGVEFFAVSAPEPTSIMGLLTMGAMALLRRRRT